MLSTKDQLEPISAEYSRLIRKRDLYKKTLAAIRVFIGSFDVKKSRTCRRAQTRLDELEKAHESFLQTQSKIDDIDERPNTQNDIHIEINEEYMDLHASLQDIIAEYDTPNPNTGEASSSLSAHSGFIKLPSVPAPTFDGSLQNWPAFIDSFNAMFHDNPNIAPVQKFHYMKTCLTGPATDIIRNIPTTSDN